MKFKNTDPILEASARLISHAESSDPIMVYIDVVDTCNLHCPCCPVGSGHGEKSSQRMTFNHFRSIVDKLTTDFHGRELTIGLYNWSEPFLHPELPRFAQHLRDSGIRFTLSTNLSLPRLDTLEQVLLSRPFAISVSLSGYTQDVYELTHRGGRIGIVKRNLQDLSTVRKRLNLSSSVYVAVKWLDYTTNSTEAKAMELLARSLGFDFLREAAGYLSWDRLLACLDGRENPYEGSERLIDSLIADPAFKMGPIQEKPILENGNHAICYYQINELCIRCTGDVYVCCLLPYREEFRVGNYLTDSIEQLRLKIQEHNFCKDCRRWKLHRPIL